MKWTVPWLCALLFVALLPGLLSGQESAAKPPKVYDVDSVWPGIKFEIPIPGVFRIDPENVIVVIQVIAQSSKAPTFLGFEKKAKGDPNKNEGPKFNVSPFSLMTATLIDQTTKNQFGTVPQPPDRPSYGPSSVVTSLAPGCWFQMSVQFKLPVLPPNPDGTIPVQKIQVNLPQAQKAIPDVIVPRK